MDVIEAEEEGNGIVEDVKKTKDASQLAVRRHFWLDVLGTRVERHAGNNNRKADSCALNVKPYRCTRH